MYNAIIDRHLCRRVGGYLDHLIPSSVVGSVNGSVTIQPFIHLVLLMHSSHSKELSGAWALGDEPATQSHVTCFKDVGLRSVACRVIR